MVMKKVMSSEDMAVIKRSVDESKKYPKGFRYSSDDGTIYTVHSNITKESHTQMRRLISSEGVVEDVTIETINKDLKQAGTKILDKGEVIEEPKEGEDTAETGAEAETEKVEEVKKLEESIKSEEMDVPEELIETNESEEPIDESEK